MAADESVLEGWRERIAGAARAGVPLRLRGAGTKDFYGEGLAGEVLDLRPWRGIVDYEPSELVITVRCGTSLSEVEAALAAHGQFLVSSHRPSVPTRRSAVWSRPGSRGCAGEDAALRRLSCSSRQRGGGDGRCA